MSQQLGIVVMIDQAAALKAGTLEGNTYLIDNGKWAGSTGEGTGNLITAANGAHWYDGSQSGECVLNWASLPVGGLPSTLPKSFLANKPTEADVKTLKGIIDKLTKANDPGKDSANLIVQANKIVPSTGLTHKVKNLQGKTLSPHIKILDVTGKPVNESNVSESASLPPIIIDITGDAVDEKVIFPAQYGSPDLVTDGWYWSATVDTSKTGIYAYTLHIVIHAPVVVNGEVIWSPVEMTHESHISVTNEPKKNGFTGAGIGVLPIV